MVEAAQQRRKIRGLSPTIPYPPLWTNNAGMGKKMLSWLNGLRKKAEQENVRQLEKQQLQLQQQQQSQPTSPFAATEPPPMTATVIEKAGVTVTSSSSYPPLRSLNLLDRLDILRTRIRLRFRYMQAYPRSPPPTKAMTTKPAARPLTNAEKRRRLVRYTVILLRILRFVPFLRYANRLPSAQRLLRREEQASHSSSTLVVTRDGRRKRRRGRGAIKSQPLSSTLRSGTDLWDRVDEPVQEQPVILSQYRMVKEPDLGFLPIMPPPPPSWLTSGFNQVRGWFVSALFKQGGEEILSPSPALPAPPSTASDGQKAGEEGPKFEVSFSLGWPFIKVQRGGEHEENKTESGNGDKVRISTIFFFFFPIHGSGEVLLTNDLAFSCTS